jgi:hypothetical protein
VIQERTTDTLTVYNVRCDHCGAQSLEAASQADAYSIAEQAGWEKIGDLYVCPDPSHAALKTMLKFLVDLNVEYIPPTDSTSDK